MVKDLDKIPNYTLLKTCVQFVCHHSNQYANQLRLDMSKVD